MKDNFEKFGLSEEILGAIDKLGYKTPSDVQQKVIPEINDGKDVVVKSQTGSGKTAAFAIPICEKIKWENNKTQALVLEPTRELAVQVKEDFVNIGRFKRIRPVAIFGKDSFSDQIKALKLRTHVVVGTPGRILDHLDRGTLDVSEVKYLVIDEADKMLNMGFIEQVEDIIKAVNCPRETMLFSATISKEIQDLCTAYMDNPTNIEMEDQELISDRIEHDLYRVNNHDKVETLNKVLLLEKPKTAVIFCGTKDNVDLVFDNLQERQYSVGKIHGGMEQKERLHVMNAFRKGDFRILVATDVAARGIDVEGITHVINVDVPMEKEAYVHRIGRTARAGESGKAITFATRYEDKFLQEIFQYIGFQIEEKEIPDVKEEELKEALSILKSKPQPKVEKAKELNKDITKIYINGGRKKKIRPGDIVGAITKVEGVTGDDIGIIDIEDGGSYVEILNGKGNKVINDLQQGTIKGKKLKVEKARKK